MVALFTRAWIEMSLITSRFNTITVALFTRAWIEMLMYYKALRTALVALFTRAWIEITAVCGYMDMVGSPSSRGRGLK